MLIIGDATLTAAPQAEFARRRSSPHNLPCSRARSGLRAGREQHVDDLAVAAAAGDVQHRLVVE